MHILEYFKWISLTFLVLICLLLTFLSYFYPKKWKIKKRYKHPEFAIPKQQNTNNNNIRKPYHIKIADEPYEKARQKGLIYLDTYPPTKNNQSIKSTSSSLKKLLDSIFQRLIKNCVDQRIHERREEDLFRVLMRKRGGSDKNSFARRSKRSSMYSAEDGYMCGKGGSSSDADDSDDSESSDPDDAEDTYALDIMMQDDEIDDYDDVGNEYGSMDDMSCNGDDACLDEYQDMIQEQDVDIES